MADVDVSLVVGNVGRTCKDSEFISSIRKVLQQNPPVDLRQKKGKTKIWERGIYRPLVNSKETSKHVPTETKMENLCESIHVFSAANSS